MDIVIDLEPIINFFSQSPYIILWRLFLLIGWIPMAVIFLWGCLQLWLYYIRSKWFRAQKCILLAIDIPRGNEQTARAVENLFTYFAGAHSTFSLLEIYWQGLYQLYFSLEIVSIDGYTQFLIWTPASYRNLVESAIYSQYPDAEITEVNDYTEGTPSSFPDEEYDIWGAEFIQVKTSAYPIKTYKNFEHQLGKPETYYKDPMASLMDLCSSLRKGEQLWYQLILVPTGFDWPKIGDREISKIIGETVKSGKNIVDRLTDKAIEWIGAFSELIYKSWGEVEEKEKKEEQERFLIMNLKPTQKRQIESIGEKVSKLGFEFKIRFIYLTKKDVMNKPKVVNGFVGFMKQFIEMDLNQLKPDLEITATTAHYLFRDYRLNLKKNKIIKAYKNRSDWVGKARGILNVEELATIWHFPAETAVKAPLIQKAPGRKAEAPMTLPVGEEIVSEELIEPIFTEGDEADRYARQSDLTTDILGEKVMPESNLDKETGSEPPDNLPVV